MIGAGVGQACSESTPCREGLACDGTCAPGHSSPTGTPCTISAECAQGDYCGPLRTCAPAGTATQGTSCASDADCASGLRCDLEGLSAQCEPDGSTDVGGACATSADCFGGLDCAGGVCTSLPPSDSGAPPLSIATWPGAECVDDPTPPVEAYFRVPRGSGDGDFFRLPFPNNVRLVNGHPSLDTFPTPGTALLGFDFVGRYVTDLRTNADGWSTYPTVTLRFSGAVDLSSLKKPGALSWLAVNDDGSTSEVGFTWTATTGRTQYVCDDSVSARPQQGQPLDSGRTYLFVVSDAVVASDGSAIQVAPDLQALLGASTPSDANVAAAYPAYGAAACVRREERREGRRRDRLHDGPRERGRAEGRRRRARGRRADGDELGRLRERAVAVPASRRRSRVRRGQSEFHRLPRARHAPHRAARDRAVRDARSGGDVGSSPSVARTEQVCMALTVPKGTMPAGGWPLVVYAHGTDGSFRSHVALGVASSLAQATDSNGKAAPMAVLGIDQVDHGTRRGGSTDTPDHLFYNFANPGAARGNPLQAAADQRRSRGSPRRSRSTRAGARRGARSSSGRSRSGAIRKGRPRCRSRCRT